MSGQSPEEDFRAAVLKHGFILRNFSADNRIDVVWKNGRFEAKSPQVRTFALFIVEETKVTDNRIDLIGKRYAVFRQNAAELVHAPAGSSVVVSIKSEADPLISALPLLKDALFFQTTQAALDAVPSMYQRAVPFCINNDGCLPPIAPPVNDCDCNDPASNGCPGAAHPSHEKAPVLQHSVEPQLTKEAQQAHVNSRVEVAVQVTASGEPTDLWIIHPIGFGLDESASNAVKQYRFAPATCHGRAVTVPLFIDVGFHVP